MARPRTVWTLTLKSGSLLHCVLWIRRPKSAVVWYWDGEVQGVEEFLDPAEAEVRAIALRDEMAVDC